MLNRIGTDISRNGPVTRSHSLSKGVPSFPQLKHLSLASLQQPQTWVSHFLFGPLKKCVSNRQHERAFIPRHVDPLARGRPSAIGRVLPMAPARIALPARLEQSVPHFASSSWICGVVSHQRSNKCCLSNPHDQWLRQRHPWQSACSRCARTIIPASVGDKRMLRGRHDESTGQKR